MLEFAESLWQKVRQEPRSNQAKLVESAHAAFAEQLSQRKPKEGLLGMQERFFSGTMAVGNKRAVEDHEFSAKNALMPADEFTTSRMVGDKKTIFTTKMPESGGPYPDLLKGLPTPRPPIGRGRR